MDDAFLKPDEDKKEANTTTASAVTAEAKTLAAGTTAAGTTGIIQPTVVEDRVEESTIIFSIKEGMTSFARILKTIDVRSNLHFGN